MKNTIKSLMLVIMLTSVGALAQTNADTTNPANGCDPNIAARDLALVNAAYTQKQADNAAVADAKSAVPLAVRNSSCFQRLKNLNITGAAGLPMGLINKAIAAVDQMCTSQLNTQLQSISTAVSKSISFPGIPGIPGTGVNGNVILGGSGGITANGQSIPTAISSIGMVPTATPTPYVAPQVQPGASAPIQNYQTLQNQQGQVQQAPKPDPLFDRIKRAVKNVF